MFVIHGNNKITLSQGDCVDIRYRVPGLKLSPGDLFTFIVSSETDTLLVKNETTFESDGDVVITFKKEDTFLLPTGNHYYSIQLSLADGRFETLISDKPFILERGRKAC